MLDSIFPPQLAVIHKARAERQHSDSLAISGYIEPVWKLSKPMESDAHLASQFVLVRQTLR